MFNLILIQVAVITLYASLWFLVALRLHRNDVADIAWGVGFIVLALTGQFVGAALSTRGLLVLVLIATWGLRLALYIGWRNRGKSEDPRYRKWREEWGSHATIRAYFQIFLLQGLLIVAVLMPVTFILSHPNPRLTGLDALGGDLRATGARRLPGAPRRRR